MEAPILGSNGMLSMHRFNDEPERVRIEACSDLPLDFTDRLIEGHASRLELHSHPQFVAAGELPFSGVAEVVPAAAAFPAANVGGVLGIEDVEDRADKPESGWAYVEALRQLQIELCPLVSLTATAWLEIDNAIGARSDRCGRLGRSPAKGRAPTGR